MSFPEDYDIKLSFIQGHLFSNAFNMLSEVDIHHLILIFTKAEAKCLLFKVYFEVYCHIILSNNFVRFLAL